ncbi:DUF7159 family protein [Mycolicibacterium phlei]|uniref:DUF7159 family protein n=1 Tax=Mycolicibacterium phlei TaxID=1771 RepID=UPI00025AD20D|nr:hypothetical protein [Mycolicibacterium phlei]EID16271.1 hypothetical protein MPHLEI_07327 [Mycolicibacterium phlei RIVM601174]
MDIVLGVSMTPTTVRMVLVEGERADGATVDHDVFDVTGGDDSATSAAAAVVDAVLGTKESALAGGHNLRAIGVTWSDHAEAAQLRDALAARGIDDVLLVSDGLAAAALAQAVGRAMDYTTTALLFIDRDTATLSVVQTDDGSVVKVLSRTLHSSDAMAVLADMAAAVAAQEAAPDAIFVVGSGVDVSAVKNHLEHLVNIPVRAPDDAAMALARGAALAAAQAPAFEASTVGLAYSQDPDGPTAGSPYALGLAAADTQLAPVDAPLAYSEIADGPLDNADSEPLTDLTPAPGEDRKPFLLVGSAMASIFVVGVVALVISLAVSIRPTADQRPAPGQSAIAPSRVVPAPPAPSPKPVEQAQPVAPPPPTTAETIKAPVPVVQQQPAPQAPPRTVYVEAPAPAPPPEAPPPAPAAPAPAPAPVPVAPAPVPVFVPPVVAPPPYYNPYNPRPQNPWVPPWSPPRPTWTPPKPTWTPPKPTWTPPPWRPPSHQQPEAPKPEPPQVPPVQNGRGGYPGAGGSSGSGPGHNPSGPSPRGPQTNCFLIFCSTHS